MPEEHPSIDPMSVRPGSYQGAPVPWTWQASRRYRTDRSSAPGERREVGGDPSEKREVPEQRPPKGTKERKVVVPQWLLRIVSLATETGDFVKALYECLPKEIRQAAERAHYARHEVAKRWSPADKAALLYQHSDKLDMKCAIFNLIFNELEDQAYGRISKHSKNPYPLPGSVSGGRSLQLSRQGDADLPHGQLPLNDLKKWLWEQL